MTAVTQVQQEDIYRIISESDVPLKASQIAKELDLPRKTVNSYLYSNPDTFKIDGLFRWSLVDNDAGDEDDCKETINDKIFTLSVFKKLHNQKNARTFSQEYFDSMADWSYGKSVSGEEPEYVFTTPTGNKIECDSGHERKMLQHIVDHRLAIEIGGQSLQIVYSTPFRKTANYYPDIVVYTTTHHIAIIETESAAFMSFHRDIERYNALEEYCEENGYLYMMVDPMREYQTFEEFRDMDVNQTVLDFFDVLQKKHLRENEPIIKNKDVKNWYQEHSLRLLGLTYSDFCLQVKSMIIWYGWYNLHRKDFEVYKTPTKWMEESEEVDEE